ncbi:MAG: hypothetical protein OXC79_01065 [Candidatus Poribacteria bacterium]|nr:hypothetical protein [Candidatus Poribacteria bacterium]
MSFQTIELNSPVLARAYGEDEPEYTTDMLKWVNPDYEGKFGAWHAG